MYKKLDIVIIYKTPVAINILLFSEIFYRMSFNGLYLAKFVFVFIYVQYIYKLFGK